MKYVGALMIVATALSAILGAFGFLIYMAIRDIRNKNYIEAIVIIMVVNLFIGGFIISAFAVT